MGRGPERNGSRWQGTEGTAGSQGPRSFCLVLHRACPHSALATRGSKHDGAGPPSTTFFLRFECSRQQQSKQIKKSGRLCILLIATGEESNNKRSSNTVSNNASRPFPVKLAQLFPFLLHDVD